MKTKTYEDYMIEMQSIADYLLAKWENEKAEFIYDQKLNRYLEDEFKKVTTLAKFLELWQQEKSEAGRRFLLMLFMYFYAVLLEQKADKKKARELLTYFTNLRPTDERRGFIQNITNIKVQVPDDKSDLIIDDEPKN